MQQPIEKAPRDNAIHHEVSGPHSELLSSENLRDPEFLKTYLAGHETEVARRAHAMGQLYGINIEPGPIDSLLSLLPVDVVMAIIEARGETDRIFFETWARSLAENANRDQKASLKREQFKDANSATALRRANQKPSPLEAAFQQKDDVGATLRNGRKRPV